MGRQGHTTSFWEKLDPDEEGSWYWILILIIKQKYKLQDRIKDLTDLQVLFLITVQDVYGALIERSQP